MSIGIGNKIIAGKSRVIPHYIGEIFHAPYEGYIPEGAVLADGSEYGATQFPTIWNDWLGKPSEGKIIWYGFSVPRGREYYSKVEHPELTPDEKIMYEKDSSGQFILSDTYGNIQAMNGSVNRSPELDVKGTVITGGRLLTCSYKEFDADVTKSGGCAKFAVDYTRNTFKVPCVGEGIYLASGDGESFAESLPNITGDIGGNKASYGGVQGIEPVFNGAFKGSKREGDSGWSGSVQGAFDLSFDAHDSNPIYQNNAKVRPNTVTLKFFVQLANGAIPNSLVDWNNYMLALANKANKDLSNVDQNLLGISRVIETKYNNDGSWFRLYSDGWLEQGGLLAETSVTFLKPFINITYTAVITPDHHWGNGADIVSWIGTKTTTGFDIVRDRSGQFNWYACGQGA